MPERERSTAVAEWSQLSPTLGEPKEVARAREAVQALRAKVADTRQAHESARRELVETEKRDREAMAAQLRQGDEPVSDTGAVQKAREAVDAAQRRSEALALAVQGAEDALGEVVRQSRDQWLRAAQRQERAARERGRRALDELTGALQALAEATVTRMWLAPEGGLDREQRARHAAPGTLAPSAAHTANRNPVAVMTVLGWIGETLREPEPPKPPAPAQPLTPVPSAMGAIISS